MMKKEQKKLTFFQIHYSSHHLGGEQCMRRSSVWCDDSLPYDLISAGNKRNV